MDAMERIERAANAVTAAIGTAEIAVILGSGLGDFGNALENAREIAYQDIPGFPRATVSKSYPDFFEALQALGVAVHITDKGA